jgi:hypothetical protein
LEFTESDPIHFGKQGVTDQQTQLPATEVDPETYASLGRDDWFRLNHLDWAKYWLAGDSADEAWSALRRILRRERYSLPSDAIYEVILELRGPADAYEALVASTFWADWTEYSGDRREATVEIVKSNHPGKINDFIFDVMLTQVESAGQFRPHPSLMGGTVVRHLLATAREPEAESSATGMVEILKELTSAWQFPMPEWIKT